MTTALITAVITIISLVVAITNGSTSSWIAAVAFAMATAVQFYSIKKKKADGTTT
ncbi:MAG: hypothetical protein WEB78_08080 [Ilumatobacteraceae bacterium]